MKNEFEKLWKNVENQIEWKRIYQAMKALDWAWRDEGIPTVTALKKTARELAFNAYTEKNIHGTGGFEASYLDDTLRLTFRLDDAECSIDEI